MNDEYAVRKVAEALDETARAVREVARAIDSHGRVTKEDVDNQDQVIAAMLEALETLAENSTESLELQEQDFVFRKIKAIHEGALRLIAKDHAVSTAVDKSIEAWRKIEAKL